MITCSNIGFNGRLANQMFQFASTVGIARKLGYMPKFPIENFFNNKGPHDYNGGKLLECFNIPSSYFEYSNVLRENIKYLVSERGFDYNKEMETIPDNVDLNGYFQSEKYFENSRREIRGIFKFKDEIISKAINLQKMEEDSTCVHIRRGDYLSSPNHHPVQSLEYYQKAFKEIGESNFYFFSDDINWCKQNFKELPGESFFVGIDNPYISLFLMAQCKNHIMANSSLSWWAAWLGKNEGQKVIAPLNWFGASLSHNNTCDLYLKEWILY